jgi:LacI family transcriptional regulator
VPLSSVNQPRFDLGRRAAELLISEIQALESGEPHQHIQERFTPTLMVRSSSIDERVVAAS